MFSINFIQIILYLCNTIVLINSFYGIYSIYSYIKGIFFRNNGHILL